MPHPFLHVLGGGGGTCEKGWGMFFFIYIYIYISATGLQPESVFGLVACLCRQELLKEDLKEDF